MLTREEFWKEQLKHAHSINALVDNHRFTLLQIFLAFHGLLLTALIFKPEIRSLPVQYSGWLPYALAIGIFVVGLTLFGAFVSQHVYMRTYKRWIGALEANLLISLELPLIGVETNHKGSLYWDDNTPFISFERTLVFTLSLFIILDIGVPVLTASLLGASPTFCGEFLIADGLLHILVLLLICRQPAQLPSQKPANHHQLQGHYAGNATDAGDIHRGWFLGHLVTDRHPLLMSPDVEIKWGIHQKGDARPSWHKGEKILRSVS